MNGFEILDKDNRIQDLDKAIYTLSRLKEYEEMEK